MLALDAAAILAIAASLRQFMSEGGSEASVNSMRLQARRITVWRCKSRALVDSR
jgi:hypothetical protein